MSPGPVENIPGHRPPRRTLHSRQFNCSVELARYTVIWHNVVALRRKNLKTSVIDLTQAIGVLIRRVRAAPASHQLSLTESAVLNRLATDGPATTADLARAESMKPQSMGTAIAALEDRGLVQRKAHPSDGRQVYIELSAKGAAVRKSVKDAKHTWLAQAITRLDEEERETLFRAGEIIKRLAEM